MIKTMVTLITANITPTIIPILELLEELLTADVAEVNTAMLFVVEGVSSILVIEVVVTATLEKIFEVVVVVVVLVAMIVESDIVGMVGETAMQSQQY